MLIIEKTGKTVEEAVNKALKEMNLTRDDVEVEILEDEGKGLFGILARTAKVKVTAKPNPVDFAFRFLSRILTEMRINVSIDIQQEDDTIKIKLQGSNLGFLIGKRGQTLDALQYLLSIAVNKYTEKYIRVVIDGEGYRERRENSLISLAKRLAKSVEETGRKVVLEPMPPNERRIIHTALQNNNRVKTLSEGQEPFRKVVISERKD